MQQCPSVKDTLRRSVTAGHPTFVTCMHGENGNEMTVAWIVDRRVHFRPAGYIVIAPPNPFPFQFSVHHPTYC